MPGNKPHGRAWSGSWHTPPRDLTKAIRLALRSKPARALSGLPRCRVIRSLRDRFAC